LDFERFVVDGDFQGNAVINYCEPEVPFTRITEHKHFAPWEAHSGSVVYREYSRACEVGDTPYYPLALEQDVSLYRAYQKLAHSLPQVTFLGRLATYRYLDMHIVIEEALLEARRVLELLR
jgi:UDP-galactopyranose mutase